MTVFQAKNAYGRGCPWSCPHAGQVDILLDTVPMARRHSDWHVGHDPRPCGAPDGPDLANRVADDLRKVVDEPSTDAVRRAIESVPSGGDYPCASVS